MAFFHEMNNLLIYGKINSILKIFIKSKISVQEGFMNKTLDAVALTIGIIGAVNWGLIGFFNFNLVQFLLGSGGIARTINAKAKAKRS